MQAKLMEMSALAVLIGQIGRQRVEFDVNVQQAAVEVIGQSIVHRNITPANQMLDVVGAHLKAPLVAYFELFGNMAWSKTEKKVVFFDVAKRTGQPALEWTEAYAAKVMAYAWYKAKKEAQPVSSFDVAEEADKLFDRLRKAARKGAELKNAQLLGKLEEVYTTFRGAMYLAKTTALPTVEDVQNAGASTEKLQQLQERFGGKPTVVKPEAKAA